MAIRSEVPNSRLAELMEEKQLNRPEIKKLDLPTTLMQEAESFKYDNQKSSRDNTMLFINKLKITPKQISDIKIATSAQNIDTEWGQYREGRITASIFRQICTRVKTLKANPSENPKALVNRIIGNTKSPNTKALKYGRALEPHAKRKYTSIVTKARKHSNFKTNNIGLAILQDYHAFHPHIQHMEHNPDNLDRLLPIQIQCLPLSNHWSIKPDL